MAALLIVGSATGAVAGQPEQITVVESGGPEVYALWSDACGFPVERTWSSRARLTFYADGSVRLHATEHETLRGPGGTVAIVHEGYNRLEAAPVVTIDETAEVATLTFRAAYHGTQRHILMRGSGTILHEAGNVSFDVTITIDLVTEAVVAFELGDFVSHGQHSQFFDPEFAAPLCEALAA